MRSKRPGTPQNVSKQRNASGFEAEPEGDGLHGKQIFRIVIAYQRRREFPFAAFKTSVQAQSGGRTGKDFPLKVAPGGTGGRQAKTDGFGGHARQTGPPRIIRADGHHAIRERFAVPIKEQLGLCLEIRFHIVMVVKVILRQVREHGPAEADARDAVLIQRVRRNFHEGHVHTGGAHVGQHGVHVEAIRSGHGRVLMMPRPAIGNRTEHAALLPGGGEQMIEQIGRGGLAVGPGHADHGERERGRAVPGAGQQPKGLAGIGRLDDFRFAAVPGGFRATDHVPGPPRHGVGNELRTISTAAGQSHKNTTGGRLAGVDAQLHPLRGHAGFQ